MRHLHNFMAQKYQYCDVVTYESPLDALSLRAQLFAVSLKCCVFVCVYELMHQATTAHLQLFFPNLNRQISHKGKKLIYKYILVIFSYNSFK